VKSAEPEGFIRTPFTIDLKEGHGESTMNSPDYETRITLILIVVFLVAAGFFLFHSFRQPARKFRRAYAGLQTSLQPGHGLVSIRFHTYDGFLVFFTQTPHEVYATPEDARILLGRLLRYNLTYGLLAAGCVFIPPISLGEYLTQRLQIRKQEKFFAAADAVRPPGSTALQSGGGGTGASLPVHQVIPELRRGRPILKTVIGWIAAALTVLFGIATIVALFRGQWEPAIGGIIFCAVLGSVAYDWLKVGR
jgi:hypothetical protein